MNTTDNFPDAPNTTVPTEASDSTADVIVAAIWIYVSPFILIIGLVVNILNVLVLRRRRFTDSIISILLPLIALADNMVLISGIIPEWLEAMDIVKFNDIHPWTCKTEKFLFYSFGDIAIWLLTTFTFDRFCAVCFPFSRRRLCTRRKVWTVCAAIVLASVLKNIGVFWTRGGQVTDAGYDNCGYPSTAAESWSRYIRPWIAFALVCVIPFVLILAFNIAIVRTLIVRQDTIIGPGRAAYSSRNRQTATMCISVSLLFLVTIIPSMVLLIGKPYWNIQSASYKISKAIANVTVFLNHSLNFFMYCLSGTQFRGELTDMLKGVPQRINSSRASTTTMPRLSVVQAYSKKMKYGSSKSQIHPAPAACFNNAAATDDIFKY